MNSINNPCGHTGFESNVCEICGYPDPSKMIASLKQQVENMKRCISDIWDIIGDIESNKESRIELRLLRYKDINEEMHKV